MPPVRADNYLVRLIEEFRKRPRESECVEFKENNKDPVEIGEYISALVGTSFEPAREKYGNEDLGNWLLRNSRPQVGFRFNETVIGSDRVVALEIEAASSTPVRFREDAWIRIGSYKKKLRDHPNHEKDLWRALERVSFEDGAADSGLEDADVIALIDYPAYFELTKTVLPENRSGILERIESDRLVRRSSDGTWEVTNLGAVLFARRMADFPSVSRKRLRVVRYKGESRVETEREQEGVLGYASGFSGIIDYITNLLPANEVVGKALRENLPMYPVLAIRELVANALIHQDFTIAGSGPMVELFDSRVEITNPGSPLVAPERFIDAPPRSRNERLASMMRRIGVCEERGSGWDKVGFEIEFHQLPAPLIELPEDSTRVVLFSPRPLREMDKEERVRALYLHACLRHVTHQHTTNSSVRERFGIESRNSAQASRLILEAVDAGLIAPYDPQAGRKYMRYVPIWASVSA